MRLIGTVFRAHNPRWAFEPTSGAGAARYGGRFNPVGVPALYTSLRMEGAWREAQQGFAFKAQPLTVCAYDVDCEDVTDLTNAATLATLHVSPETLSCAWESLADRKRQPLSWDLALRLIAGGTAAALVPSFAPGAVPADVNVVFWRWADALPHRVRVIDDERRLPRDDVSWISDSAKN